MTFEVLCLRPELDFERAGAMPPSALGVRYRAPGDADVFALMKSAQALVIPAVGPKLETSLFQQTNLKLVQVTGAGIDRLDRDAIQKLGIPVANVPGGSNSAVAEYAVTAASLLLRRLCWADSEIRKGNYASYRARMLAENLAGLEGLLVGVIGFGTIGVAVAEAFHKMGCRICFYDPVSPNSQAAQKLGAREFSLSELLKQADIVTLHLPLLPETAGLISTHELTQMKKGAILIQASRGGIVDESALAGQLNSGHIGGAAVDVYSSEPPTKDNPLLKLGEETAQRILLTPHIAGVTRQSAAFLFRSAWENVERVLIRNEKPLNRVF